jgi:hypothetical protein
MGHRRQRIIMTEQIFTLESDESLHIFSPKTGSQFYLLRSDTGELQIKCSDVVVVVDERDNEIRIVSGQATLLSAE